MKQKIVMLALALACLAPLSSAARTTAEDAEAPKKFLQLASSHLGTGKVVAIYPEKLAIRISHGPIVSLNWPAMVMGFNVVKASVLQGIKVGDNVQFELGKPRPTDALWVIVKIERK